MDDAAVERMDAAHDMIEREAYELILFVSGASASSARAIRSVQAVCSDHLFERHTLRVVDVNQEPELARGSRILATPTLLKVAPAPQRMLVGDLSDGLRVLTALGIAPPYRIPIGRAG